MSKTYTLQALQQAGIYPISTTHPRTHKEVLQVKIPKSWVEEERLDVYNTITQGDLVHTVLATLFGYTLTFWQGTVISIGQSEGVEDNYNYHYLFDPEMVYNKK